MRQIDADALKELFSEVIGRIAQKPEMNGNLEHMIRASAMVIQMIDDAPTVQPDTTTHDSIPAKIGKNDGDRISGDCISRQQSVDALRKMQTYKLLAGDDMLLINQAEAQTELMMLPSVQPFHNITMTDVLKYIDGMPEDVWLEFTECLKCRGWELQWCGGDFA